MATKARAESSYRAHQSGLVSLRHLALCYRAFFILFQVTVGMFFLDLSIGRLEYHYRLSSNLGPVKAEVLKDIFVYHGRIPSEFRNCQAYDREKDVFVVNCKLSACEQNAVLLSESRQEILHQVRNSHPASRLAGEIFDGARGLDQSLKIEDLFGRKSCEQVIGSADKTNWMDKEVGEIEVKNVEPRSPSVRERLALFGQGAKEPKSNEQAPPKGGVQSKIKLFNSNSKPSGSA